MVPHTSAFSVKQVVNLNAFLMRGADLTLGRRFFFYLCFRSVLNFKVFYIYIYTHKEESFNYPQKKLFQMVESGA